MIANFPAIDALRLTTFDSKAFDILSRAVGPMMLDGDDLKIMQYEGRKSGPIFMGVGTQQGKDHYLFEVKGEQSDQLGRELVKIEGLKATRLDVQLTLPLPANYSARSLYDTCLKGAWQGVQGRAPQPRLFQNPDGMDTVSIGAKTSDKLIRIYVKADSKGGLWLRFEVEYRKRRAEWVSGEISRTEDSTAVIGSVLLGELVRFPPSPFLKPYIDLLQDARRVPYFVRMVEPNSTFRWLNESVGPAITRLANDHDYGWRVREWLEVQLKELQTDV